MGISPFHISVEAKPEDAPPTAPNPNPRHFEIIKAQPVGPHVVALIRYPECTTYEGNKVLLYKDTTPYILGRQRFLDPHFSETRTPAPFARFEPTEAGWTAALFLAQALNLR